MPGMGVLFDYFTAPDDATAARTIAWSAGPARPTDGSPPHPCVHTGIDPAVQGATLEQLMTGRDLEAVMDDPRWADSLAMTGAGERLVLTMTDGLVDALASADERQLTDVALPWSRTEEFVGSVEPSHLAGVLRELAALARRARAQGHGLYCWASV